MNNQKIKIFTVITVVLLTILFTGMVSATNIDNSTDTQVSDITQTTPNVDIQDNDDNVNTIESLEEKNIKQESLENMNDNSQTDSHNIIKEDSQTKKDTQTYSTTITLDELTDEYATEVPLNITGRITTDPSSYGIFALDLFVNNEKVDRIYTSESGFFTATYTPTQQGIYTVRVEYDGLDNYQSSVSNNQTFTVKYYTNLIITSENITDDTNFLMEGYLYDRNYIPLTNAPVDIYINNQKVNQTMTTSSGKYTYGYTIIQPGNYTASIVYEGNDTYASSRNSTRQHVVKYNTSLTLDSLSEKIVIPNAIHITGQFSSEMSPTLERFLIDIIVDNKKVGSVYTYQNGKYEYYYKPQLAGSYMVKVQFAGDESYKASTSNEESFVALYNFTITTEQLKTGYILQEPVTICGNISTGVSIDYSYYNLNIIINGDINLVEIDEDGSFEYIFTPTQVGNYSVKLEHDATDLSLYSESNVQTFKAYYNTSLKLYELNKTYEISKPVNIIGDIYVQGMDDEENLTIDIYINNQLEAQQSTDIYGMITYTFTPTEIGKYNISLRYCGNEILKESSSDFQEITVLYYTNLTVDTLEDVYIVNNPITITGKLTSTINPIEGLGVDIIINDEKISTVLTDSNGEFKYIFIPSESGKYNIKAIYNGSDNILKSTSNNQSIEVYYNSTLEVNQLDEIYPTNTSIVLESKVISPDAPSLQNLEVRVYVNDELDGITHTNAEGICYYHMNPTQFGNYTIKLEFIGTDNILPSTNTQRYTCKYNTSIKMYNLEDTYNISTPVTITGDFSSDNSDNLENINIDIYINDQKVAQETTDIYGMFRYTFTPTNASVYTITLKYEGNDEFLPSQTNGTFIVEGNANIYVDAVDNITLGQSTLITGKLTDGNNNLLANQTIELLMDENIIDTTITNDEGLFAFNVTPNKTGTNIYKINYKQTPVKNITSNVEIIVDDDIQPTLIVETESSAQKINITAKITRDTTTITDINNGKVIFKVNGKILKDDNGKVIYIKILNGTAVLTDYTIPSTWDENTTIEAVYMGSKQCTALKSEKTNITLPTPEPTLTITPFNNPIQKNSTITLSANVQKGDSPITTGKIIFKINGKTIKDANGKVIYAKVVNGSVSVDYTIPESYKLTEYTLTAIYIAGDYGKLQANTTLTVVSS